MFLQIFFILHILYQNNFTYSKLKNIKQFSDYGVKIVNNLYDDKHIVKKYQNYIIIYFHKLKGPYLLHMAKTTLTLTLFNQRFKMTIMQLTGFSSSNSAVLLEPSPLELPLLIDGLLRSDMRTAVRPFSNLIVLQDNI